MAPYKICIVGGHCGLRMMMVAEHLGELLEKAGYHCEMSHQSLWDHPFPPRAANLVLELLPAYTEAEVGCPVLSIKPLLADLDHPQIIEKIFERVRGSYPLSVGQPAEKMNVTF